MKKANGVLKSLQEFQSIELIFNYSVKKKIKNCLDECYHYKYLLFYSNKVVMSNFRYYSRAFVLSTDC